LYKSATNKEVKFSEDLIEVFNIGDITSYINKSDIEEAKYLAKFHNIKIMFVYSERNFNKDTKIKNTTEQDVKKEIKQLETSNSYKSYKISEKKSNFNPKCLHTNRDVSYSNTGHILPCCWLNTRYKEPGIKELFNERLHINNNKVKDIINSKEWIDFFNNLKSDTAPKTCRKFCTGALEDNPEETKVRYENNLL
jgi:hypothetical protein